MTRLLLILAAIGLVGYGLFFALFGSTSYTWHQRLTVIVDTPAGQAQGAAVTAVRVTDYHGAINLPNGGHGSWEMWGEAVVVEVLPGRYLFALLNGGDNPNAAAAAWTGTTFKQRDFPNENGISFDELRTIIKSEPRDTPILAELSYSRNKLRAAHVSAPEGGRSIIGVSGIARRSSVSARRSTPT